MPHAATPTVGAHPTHTCVYVDTVPDLMSFLCITCRALVACIFIQNWYKDLPLLFLIKVVFSFFIGITTAM